LDAAHITPDHDPQGEPVVSNGVSLCKIHHAAFDRHFFGIRPDCRVVVRPEIMREEDGPMLRAGLQQIDNVKLVLPRSKQEYPDPKRLAARYQTFRESVLE
jgi:putative restriction endonuclease